MQKVGEIKQNGRFCIYKNDDAVNPYKLIRKWKELGEYGISERQKKIGDYADLKSCVAEIYSMI